VDNSSCIALCLTFPGAYVDYPFDDDTANPTWTVLRHRNGKRCFAFFHTREGRDRVNLKCAPLTGDFLRASYKSILPAFHMNKVHWITVVMGGDADTLLPALLRDSYEMTR
jgi:predicted DNA-binding protein (MmcQ/YjbR family)